MTEYQIQLLAFFAPIIIALLIGFIAKKRYPKKRPPFIRAITPKGSTVKCPCCNYHIFTSKIYYGSRTGTETYTCVACRFSHRLYRHKREEVDQSKITERLEYAFLGHRNREIAGAQEKYMRSQFPFLGLKKPLRDTLQRGIFPQKGTLQSNELLDIASLLFQKEEREYTYAACDLLKQNHASLEEAALPHLKTLIETKSWWDTVDILASSVLGALVMKYPSLQKEMTKWIDDTSLWIQRSALLFQLKYKKQTDQNLLFSFIEKRMRDREFFIQKAIGWSLREYSKTAPSPVFEFIEKNRHALSPLAIREGLKYLEN